jgi:hypothetical protein
LFTPQEKQRKSVPRGNASMKYTAIESSGKNMDYKFIPTATY